MKQTPLKIGLVCLALFALAAVPVASADVYVRIADNNDDGDCTDSGEQYRIGTTQAHGWVWVQDECAPYQP